MKQLPFTAQAVLLLAVTACLPSCVLKKPQTVKAAPPAPTPAVAAAPAQPPEPLSVPQTDVHLPPPQRVTPEAAATTVPPEPAGTPPPPRPAARPKPAAPTRTDAPPAAQPATPTPAEPERPTIQEVTPAAEQKRLQDEASARKNEVRRLVEPLDRRRLNRQQRGMLDRVESFVKQSDDAERRGDMRQASELAQRALVLARELKP